ncbi:DNA glycosylase [uncultured Desulfobulbus sp.]|uniref:DNA glycosylase n=1 Tax=uncultured Desulfobulbus sp. TaxID=239745 RepID=UPI0029C7F978|nr:DNA glycosylase [uncultured Desulfobulbus sp.]
MITDPKTHILHVNPDELNLTHTLTPGQSFRWKQDEQDRWVGVIGNKVIRIWRDGPDIAYQVFPDGDGESMLYDYFRLDVKLADLYQNFIDADPRMEPIINRFKGLRLLRQEPVETLLSYICSAANSVPRISNAVEIISSMYGNLIAVIDDKEYYSFPTIESILWMDVAHTAKLCGLGFRCRKLHAVAEQLSQKPCGWLNSLRDASYDEARLELLKINGVGMKIADCVMLFSLDKDQSFPVDTHIRKVAVNHYMPEFKQKTLTPAVYDQIISYFQNKFGRYAGWAQEYIFYDDLLKRQKEVD